MCDGGLGGGCLHEVVYCGSLQTLVLADLGSNPGSAAFLLCDLGQVT